MQHRTYRKLILAVFVFIFSSISFEVLAANLYVNTTGDDTHNCTDNVADACLTIGRAITVATTGDTINVAAGTYAPSATLDFSNKNLKLIGNSAADTIIASTASPALKINNGQNNTTSVENLTISTNVASAYAILTSNTSPQFINLTVKSTGTTGRGMSISGGNVYITGCLFQKITDNAIMFFAGTGSGKAIIHKNIFVANGGTSVHFWGGNKDSIFEVSQNIFVGNANTIISDNFNTDLNNQFKGSFLVYNNTIVGNLNNSSLIYQTNGRFTIKNNILALNDGNDYYQSQLNLGYQNRNNNLVYSNTNNYSTSDTGNVTSDPLFTVSDTGTSTAVGSNTLTDTTKNWTVNQWKGYYLQASNSLAQRTRRWFYIESNTATTLTVTVANTNFEIQDYAAIGNTYKISDLTLQGTSPAINAGDSNSIYNNIGGSRNDMGYTGGPNGPLPYIEMVSPTIKTVAYGDSVTLDGSLSVSKPGTTLTYLWEQTSGTAVTLSDATAQSPNFTAPNSVGLLTFKLTVTDSDGRSFTSTRDFYVYVHEPVYINGAGTAYSTIAAAVTAAVANDTINIGSGTYAESVTINKALTLVGEGQANTIMDGFKVGDLLNPGASSGAFYITAGPTTVRDMTIRNLRGAGLGTNTNTNLTFTNLTISGNQYAGIQTGGNQTKTFTNITTYNNGSSGLVSNNTAGSSNYDKITSYGNVGDGINDNGIVTIKNSILFNNSGNGAAGGRIVLFENNIVGNNNGFMSTTNSTGNTTTVRNNTFFGQYSSNAITLGGTAGTYDVYNNLITNSDFSVDGLSCQAGPTFNADYNLYYNSVTTTDADCPAKGSHDLTSTDPKFTKNYTSTSTGLTATTLTKSGANWTVDQWKGYFVVPDTSTAARSRDIFYIASNTADTLTVYAGSTNLEMIDRSKTSGQTFFITNLKPASDGPGVNAGYNSNASTTDIAGTSRPQAVTVDMGAYEYEPPPTVQFSSTTSNGSEATASPTITISLSASYSKNVTVDYAVTGGTASGTGTDFTLASGTATINSGSTSVTISPTIVSDSLDEADETIQITLSNPTNSTLGTNTVHTYTINDDDATPSLSVNDVSLLEMNNGGSNSLMFTVTLSAASGQTVTVDYATSDVTATAGSDYTAVTSTTLTFNPGDTTKTFNVNAAGDDLDEPDETFTVTLSNAANATISDSSGTGTITDNDNAPSVYFSSPSSNNSEATASPNLAVTLSAASGRSITVDYALSGTATGTGTDYTLAAGTLTFNAGVTSLNITPTIVDDNLDESNETLIVTLSNPSNASLGGNTAHTYTINDNDATPTLAVADVTVNENAGTATVTVSMTDQSASSVTVNYATSNGTATSGSDYTSASGTLTWTSGQTGAKTFTVTISDDSLDEANETVTVTLSGASNATISDASGAITINDNDATPSIAFASATSNGLESATGPSLTVNLSAASGQNTSVDYAVTGGTATGGGTDFTLASGTLTISAGSTSNTISLSVVDDGVAESNETVQVTISNPTNSTLGANTVHTYTINDNDTPGVTIVESGGSVVTTEASVTDTYTVVLNTEPTADVTLTPTPNAQVTVSPTSLTFTVANWNTPQTITVTAVNDSIAEGAHTGQITHATTSVDGLYNNLAGIANVNPTITDNDTAGVSLAETGGSTAFDEDINNDTYTVVLTSQPTNNVTITLSYGGQITTTPSSLTFTSANWNTPQTVTASGIDDNVVEGAHTANITHTAASTDTNYNAISIGTITTHITDDDSAGVTITQTASSTQVAEGGVTDTYVISLTSQPTGSATFSVATDAQLTVSPTSFTLNAANWNTGQTITVTAVDDNQDDPGNSSTITHTISSSNDANYPTNMAINSVVVNITDNETAGVTITQPSGGVSIVEGSTTGSYTVALTSQPAANVTITPSASGLTLTPSALTFTATNWHTPQTMIVSKANDNVSQGNRSVTVSHTTTSSDSTYQGLSVNSVTVSVSDPQADDDDEVNTAPTVSAGANFSAVETTSVTLAGSASDAEGDSLSYQWTQALTSTCSQSVSLSGSASLTPSFTIPAGSSCFTFKLSASDGSLSAQASVTVTVLKKEVTTQQSTVIENKVVATSGSTMVTTRENVKFNGKSSIELNLGNGIKAYTNSTADLSISADDKIIIGDPHYNNDTGRVIAIDTAIVTTTLDLTSPDLDLVNGVIVANGTNSRSLFGYRIDFGDIEGDGIKEVITLAPGTTYGSIYILDQNTLEIRNLLLGSEQEQLKSTLMAAANINGSFGDDIFAGVNVNGVNASRSHYLTANADISDAAISFNGILSDSDLPTVVDFAEDNPDFVLDSDVTISSVDSGDINGDDISDLILASSETCEIYIYFGDSDIGINETALINDSVIPCTEDTTFTSLAVEDITGDGISDIVLGFPEAVSGNGRIYILTGKNSWQDEDFDMDNALVITGTSDNQIGEWLVIGDANGDGINDILTSTSSSSTHTSVITLSTLTTGDTETDALQGSRLGGGGFGCTLSAAPESNHPERIFFQIVCVLGLIWATQRILARKM